jgi:hypothetical protein
MTTTHEETTTMGEGAQISVIKCKNARKDGGTSIYTELVATRGSHEVRMRVDNMTPQNLRAYLYLVIRQIERERKCLTSKPLMPYATTKDFRQFVHNMAYHDMFIFDVLNDGDNTGTTKEMVQGRGKIQGESQVLPDSDGTMQRSGKAKGNRRRKAR